MLLRSDGNVVACGDNDYGQIEVPSSSAGISFSQVSAGYNHTVLLQSDGCAVAFGANGDGECCLPWLEEGIVYTQISAGYAHTVLLRSDGKAVACGQNSFGQCDIPSPEPGICYTSNFPLSGDLVLQLDFVHEDDDDGIMLICSSMAGKEEMRLTAQSSDLARDTLKSIARDLNVPSQSFRLVLPNGQLLASICRSNPKLTLADAAEHGRLGHA